MQHFPNDHLEHDLAEELQRAEGPYRRALAILKPFPSNSSGDQVTACLARLQPHLKQIESHEGVLAPLRQRWIAQAAPAGQRLAAILKGHEELLRELIGSMAALEDRARQVRQNMVPAVDGMVRHQQMQRAYQQSSG